MHRLAVEEAQIREAIQRLIGAGFSPAQAKAIIVTIKVIHDGPWAEPEEQSSVVDQA